MTNTAHNQSACLQAAFLRQNLRMLKTQCPTVLPKTRPPIQTTARWGQFHFQLVRLLPETGTTGKICCGGYATLWWILQVAHIKIKEKTHFML